MKSILFGAVIAATGLVCAFTSRHDTPKQHSQLVNASTQGTPDPLLKRGDYLVRIMGCGDCHSPKKMSSQGPVPDMDRLLSGYDSRQPLGNFDRQVVKSGQWVLFNGQNTAFVGPWGVSFAANLTPHATGIGSWSLAQFTKAMREGKAKGLATNRSLLPPMPWPNYTQLTDTDIKAIFTYLKSLKPVPNTVPAPMPPTP